MDPPAAATTTLAAAPVVPVPSLLVPTMSAGSLGDALRREEFELQRDVSHILAIPAIAVRLVSFCNGCIFVIPHETRPLTRGIIRRRALQAVLAWRSNHVLHYDPYVVPYV